MTPPLYYVHISPADSLYYSYTHTHTHQQNSSQTHRTTHKYPTKLALLLTNTPPTHRTTLRLFDLSRASSLVASRACTSVLSTPLYWCLRKKLSRRWGGGLMSVILRETGKLAYKFKLYIVDPISVNT